MNKHVVGGAHPRVSAKQTGSEQDPFGWMNGHGAWLMFVLLVAEALNAVERVGERRKRDAWDVWGRIHVGNNCIGSQTKILKE